MILRWPALAFAALVVCLLAIYGADIGHGFVKDDVVWVGENGVESVADVRALLTRSSGFYRPVVGLSFGIDRLLYDTRPFGFGLTNFLLLIACAAALAWLARGLGLGPGTAVLAAAIWALNFHGINMAVLWISGRTALLVVVFSLIAAGAFVRGMNGAGASGFLVAGVAGLLAMLSKEEAVLLPLILSAWAWLRAPRASPTPTASNARGETHALRASGVARIRPAVRAATLVRQTWPLWLALLAYIVLRSQTAAYTPATSPWFYRFTFAPAAVLMNLLEYADRACTFSALAVAVAALVTWRRPAWSGVREIVPLAIVWLVGSYALTLFLPVRSSLYACLPSVGPALVAVVAIDTIWRAAPVVARRRLAAVCVIVVIGLLPVYWSRNVRWVEIADLSAATFAAVRDTVARHPHASHLVFEDDRSTRRSLVSTFGTLLPDAMTLATGRRLAVWLEPPPDDWEGSGLTRPPTAPSPGDDAQILRFRVEGGTLIAPTP